MAHVLDRNTTSSNSTAAAAESQGSPFSQTDWEFELDLMSGATVEQLSAHLDKAGPEDLATAGALKQFLMDRQAATFVPFN
jgi:hypothetical protein